MLANRWCAHVHASSDVAMAISVPPHVTAPADVQRHVDATMTAVARRDPEQTARVAKHVLGFSGAPLQPRDFIELFQEGMKVKLLRTSQTRAAGARLQTDGCK